MRSMVCSMTAPHRNQGTVERGKKGRVREPRRARIFHLLHFDLYLQPPRTPDAVTLVAAVRVTRQGPLPCFAALLLFLEISRQ